MSHLGEAGVPPEPRVVGDLGQVGDAHVGAAERDHAHAELVGVGPEGQAAGGQPLLEAVSLLVRLAAEHDRGERLEAARDAIDELEVAGGDIHVGAAGSHAEAQVGGALVAEELATCERGSGP